MPRSTHRPAKKRALSPGKFANRVRATRRRADKKRLELRRDHLLRELEELDRMEAVINELDDIDARWEALQKLVTRTLKANRDWPVATIGDLFTLEQIKEIDDLLNDDGVSLAEFAQQHVSVLWTN